MIVVGKEEYVVGVDVGGTWTRVALFNTCSCQMEKVKEKVDTQNATAISDQILRMTRLLCKKMRIRTSSLRGLGIASAGPLDIEEGALVKPPNLPFKQVSLVKPIKDKLHIPVFLLNDCTAAVLGESMFGEAQKNSNLFYVSLGTGIGGGAIVDNHLLIGKDGNAHEIGHFTIDYLGKLECGCGRRGHWEAYCSGRNIPNFVDLRIRETGKEIFENKELASQNRVCPSKISAETLFGEAKNGNQRALQIVEEIGILNAIGFANVVNAYDPSQIIIGGAVALENSDLILSPIKKHIAEYAINRIPEIKTTSLGYDVGIYGGIASVLRVTCEV